MEGDKDNVKFSGYLIDMIDALSKDYRANFTYDLLPPSGLGSLCAPQVTTNTSSDQVYSKEYRTQYNCGASDVNDRPPRPGYSTDFYLGMYYVTPTRQLVNQFTIPFLPPFSGTLAMFGTATGIDDFDALVEHQSTGKMDPEATCGPAGTALIESVIESFPGLKVRGIYGGEEEIYQSFVDRSCQVYITDGPLAAHFVLRRSRQDQCTDIEGNPIGVIGNPMHYGLSHYAIGIRHDIPIQVVNTLNYWMNILMTCNPLDPEGPCPDGNFASFYDASGGTGAECGYVLHPSPPTTLSAGAIVGVVIACVVFVSAVYTAWHKYRLHKEKRRNAKEFKAAMAQAQREREFNEYMAHEVRNPLASALAALSFVSSKASDPIVVPSEESRSLIKSDINVIDSSLQFVNELLRNMLDLHRTQNGHEIKLHLVPTDVLSDILEPVSTILFMRGAAVEIQLDCPKNLYIKTDRMRLKQICLNLSNNATKFVRKGYIRLRAEVVHNTVSSDSDDYSIGMSDLENGGKPNRNKNADPGSVVVYIEDSGPGIPEEKRQQLFRKFQDSLDVLNQGTGIGLSVCKNLSELLGGSLGLDDDFDSGVPGCPGTRFVLQLNQSPLNDEQIASVMDGSDNLSKHSLREDLPESLSVLFVDDDLVLRKMFSRVLKMAAPTWSIKEASNGETALKIVDSEVFDVIFIDQYMASVEKQLLGTETIAAMRAKGVPSIICGLSANDIEEQFLAAGANAFMNKPFPCKKEALKDEFRRMLLTSEREHSGSQAAEQPSRLMK